MTTDLAKIAQYFDHTLLRADARREEIEKLCDEAKQLGTFSVCVNPTYISLAKARLVGSSVKVCSVVGFPLGATLGAIKRDEAKQCLDLGATEIDMVAAVGSFLSGDHGLYGEEIVTLRKLCESYKATLKVIIETALLSTDQVGKCTGIVAKSGAHFVKTSTGFSSRGASLEDIAIIKNELESLSLYPKVGIKASGGIKTAEASQALIAAGATRLGSSGTANILKHWDDR